ncbi:LacI family DNA-binding transcriptional regulator [Leucobacter weissii]|uniref:LacI family DNA-binding transcriptional regulator n=1 Tax=Leucobacter weissii TaxID=1983706 RepID=A0A939MHV5_9MICO|nr:LacI family DNA-binding transcriptional regulator [Leucobacter weissii]MBO1901028.1 LacI family DNA-binding transcriptional regulator [Leucobacter weissii]
MTELNGQRGRQRPSIYDVARVAGVSHMTVSRVLNEHPNIKPATRERVMRAIVDTGYTPSSIARALATKKAMRIGVIVDSPVQFGPNSTLRALERAAREAGYAVSAYSITDGEGRGIDTGAIELVTEGVDALCVIAPRVSSLDLLSELKLNLPRILIKSEPHPGMHTAGVDQHAGAVLAVDHLVSLGHRSIVHVAGPRDWYDARVRERGWRDALTAAGISEARHVVGDWTSDFGYEFAREFEVGEATAVFAANDQMALGIIHGFSERGLRVPEDISVVGFDDLPDARHFLPPLTTVRQDFAALGALAMRSIATAISGTDTAMHEKIDPRLKVRASTTARR